ncbi:hypothetical protein SLEP1_g50663 [Rubroshorea leprosula]|uniref:Uncharacterized protein n=1 Tax=Rubroshorea leprosula TaxID=152421 RepID=A0AAV5M1N5_9ROSI|nr:hypothetical protein SLEP1_g50663 [Rubroshorea leprosula]
MNCPLLCFVCYDSCTGSKTSAIGYYFVGTVQRKEGRKRPATSFRVANRRLPQEQIPYISATLALLFRGCFVA